MQERKLNTKNKNLKTDIELLNSYILNSSSQQLEENSLTPFESGDKVFACTNEDLFLYPSLDIKNKRVLSITSSGDHILNAILNGAKEVVGFDINRFCKYYLALKIGMIKKYDLYDYFNKLDFTCIFDNFYEAQKNTLFDEVLNDVLPYLTNEEKTFWTTFNNLTKINDLETGFFHTCAFDEDIYNIPWVSEDKYLLLKEELMNNHCKIKYIDSNIDNLRNTTKGKFDSIYISNILGRMYGHTDYKKNKFTLIFNEIIKEKWCHI